MMPARGCALVPETEGGPVVLLGDRGWGSMQRPCSLSAGAPTSNPPTSRASHRSPLQEAFPNAHLLPVHGISSLRTLSAHLPSFSPSSGRFLKVHEAGFAPDHSLCPERPSILFLTHFCSPCTHLRGHLLREACPSGLRERLGHLPSQAICCGLGRPLEAPPSFQDWCVPYLPLGQGCPLHATSGRKA